MEQVQVRESNSEILIFIDRNMGDKLAALEEGVKILQREVLRVKAHSHTGRYADNNKLSQHSEPN